MSQTFSSREQYITDADKACLSYTHMSSAYVEPIYLVKLSSVLRIRIRDPGSWILIRYPGSNAFLTSGSGIQNRFFPDPEPIFLRA
jgi:hypothetical protein